MKIDVLTPILKCIACGEARASTPKVVVHVSQIEQEARAAINTDSSYIATNCEPPRDWLVLDLQVTGSQMRLSMAFCPLCRTGDAILAKSFLSALRQISTVNA